MINKANPGLIVMAMLLVLIGAGSAAADLADGLVAHWKLDGNANDSAGSNDGTLVNGPVWTTGKISGALEFDGVNDYVSLSNNAVTTTEFTVSGWANQFGLGGGVEYTNMIFAQNDAPAGDNHSAVMLYAERDGTARALIRSSSGTRQILFSPSKNYNEWHHYAMTVDSNDFIFYINGVEVARTTNNQAGNYTTSIDNVGIGRMFSNGENKAFFNGVIDEVRIYNRALSADEVCQLYGGDLLGLEVVGPDKVAENSQAQYKAIAHYEMADVDVTDLADWLVEPNDVASISAGLLTTEIIDLPEEVTISAEYTEDPNTVYAEKEVSILAICPSGSALDFDGVDDYVDLGDTTKSYLGIDYSVSAWIKPEVLNYIHQVAAYRLSFGSGVLFQLQIENSDVKFIVRDNSNNIAIANYSNAIEIGNWYHVVGVRKGDTLSIYVNGVNGTSDSSIFGTITVDNLKIGTLECCNEPLISFFDGIIDDVRIYNRALSGEEIQVLMHTRPDGEPNLVGYWDFDEGSGQEAADSSGNGNDGTLGSTGGVDYSDPNWVDSVPPVGICNLEGLVGRNISNVLDIKADILELLDIALGKEEALLDYMDDAFHNGQYDNLNKGDVVQAKQKLHSAIQHEEQAETTIGQSLEKLNDALDALGIDPTSWHQSEIEEEIIRADINADGVVDFRDFTILTEHWLKSYGP